MSRARNIKPGYFRNEELAECQPLARILFAGLWCEADREGRLEDRPRRLKADVLPYDNCDVDDLLSELAARKFVLRYVVNGQRYIQVLAFLKHQDPHYKERQSEIPPPPTEEEPKSANVETTITQSSTDDRPTIGQTSGELTRGESPLIPSSLIPDSLSLDSGLLIPDPPIQKSSSAALEARRPKEPPNEANRETWAAYAQAYSSRYSVPPVRNAKVNGMVARLVERLGAEAPAVAGHYLTNNSQFYVQSAHCVDLLLRDAEKLRTEWATGRRTTNGQARQLDSTQTTFNVFSKIIEEQKATTQ